MALSCSSLCGRLSLVRQFGLRTSIATNGLYSPCVFPQPSEYSELLLTFGDDFGQMSPLCRHFSSSDVRLGIGRYVVSSFQWGYNKYLGFLKRRFPRIHELYTRVFLNGFKLLYQDTMEMTRIKAKMGQFDLKFQDLSYREMEKLRQVHRNMLKGVPLAILTIPPFTNLLFLALVLYFPRQFLIPHFWTPEQQLEFRGIYHSLRSQHHRPVLEGLQRASGQVTDGELQSRLKDLCAMVQRGGNPRVSEILAVRRLFSGPPLGIKRISASHTRHLSPLLFLTPYLPSFVVSLRLKSYALQLLQIDRALGKLGPSQLSDPELRNACYVRGLNSDKMSPDQCREWLSRWLQVSTALNESELSLLLHTIVFLTANYPSSSGPH